MAPVVNKSTPYPLGWHPEAFDVRSLNYPISEILDKVKAQKPITKMWESNANLDQGQIPGCVGWAQAMCMASAPTIESPVTNAIGLEIYHIAQTLDPWAGQPHDGSTITAGAKAVMQKEIGMYDSYRFITNINDLILTIGYIAPVIMGTSWYNSMFTPDTTHFIKVDVSSGLAGGHSYSIVGYNAENKFFTIHNNWSNSWGLHGKAYITQHDLNSLLTTNGGQALVMVNKHLVQVS